jgi:YD repeat-containing protein
MRCGRLIIIALLLPSCGCSALIADGGKDLSPIKTREQIRTEFGNPDESGQTTEEAFDTYHTRRKVSEQIRSWQVGMGVVMTYGLAEVLLFPNEVYLLTRRTALGQELKFFYDSSGRVIRIHLDGEDTVCHLGPVNDSDSDKSIKQDEDED